MSCCAQCPHFYLPSTEYDQHNYNVRPIISFHVYQKLAHCIVHGRHPLNEDKLCKLCEAYTDAIVTKKLSTRNRLSLWSHKLWTFIKTYKFLKYRNLYFTYHTYALSGHITVATRVKRHSIIFRIYNMCCAVVIMKNVY